MGIIVFHEKQEKQELITYLGNSTDGPKYEEAQLSKIRRKSQQEFLEIKN